MRAILIRTNALLPIPWHSIMNGGAWPLVKIVNEGENLSGRILFPMDNLTDNKFGKLRTIKWKFD